MKISELLPHGVIYLCLFTLGGLIDIFVFKQHADHISNQIMASFLVLLLAILKK